nr:MAG TPA: hypothetical protein [Caudoviricetes sp.]
MCFMIFTYLFDGLYLSLCQLFHFGTDVSICI